MATIIPESYHSRHDLLRFNDAEPHLKKYLQRSEIDLVDIHNGDILLSAAALQYSLIRLRVDISILIKLKKYNHQH